MNLVGIDLAASPASTGVVVLAPLVAGRWEAVPIDEVADDDLLVDVVRGAVAVGVDAPLGWPDAFVDAVGAHRETARWPGGVDRSPLTHRETDRFTKPFVGRLPLSASADLLGVVAMRCALLQQRWADEVWGTPAPRDGTGHLSETYPAAALTVWQLDAKGYKSRRDREGATRVRASVVEHIAAATSPWLDLGATAERSVASDHVLDALVCALVALAVHRDATHPVPADQRDVARREGWIHIPSVPLSRLSPG
jgi:predicted nuclease with RNAse H fold